MGGNVACFTFRSTVVGASSQIAGNAGVHADPQENLFVHLCWLSIALCLQTVRLQQALQILDMLLSRHW